MKSKYIKDTNKQYSIREDGSIIRHYFNHRNGIIYKKLKITIDNKGCVFINYPIKKRARSNQLLLFENFGFRLCSKCNNKIYNKSNNICNTCQLNKKRQTDKIHRLNNLETHRLLDKKKIDNITNSYVSHLLKESVNNLPKELIELKRKQLKLKRIIKTKQNESR